MSSLFSDIAIKMDVLVMWEEETKNIVDSRELKLNGSKSFSVGCHVKMLYDGIWYKGKVIAVEDEESQNIKEDSTTDSDDHPLGKLNEIHNNRLDSDAECGSTDDVPIAKYIKPTPTAAPYTNKKLKDRDPTVDPFFGQCEFPFCKDDV